MLHISRETTQITVLLFLPHSSVPVQSNQKTVPFSPLCSLSDTFCIYLFTISAFFFIFVFYMYSLPVEQRRWKKEKITDFSHSAGTEDE